MRAVAIFVPNWIGDVVMATPAIAALRAHWPAARLFAVGKPYVADVLAGLDWFEDFIPFDRASFLNCVRYLRDVNAHAAVLFPNSLRPALAARLAGCRTVAGFARYGRDVLLSHRAYAARDVRGGFKPRPILDDYNRVVTLLGVPTPGRVMTLATTPRDDHRARDTVNRLKLSRFRNVIGLNPGGAFGSSKHWSTESFAHVARHFAERLGVVVLCGPAEREEARNIAALANMPGVVSLAEEALSIGFTKSMVKSLDLLITTDSGPRHFAAAFNVPVVTLFGPTHIAWTETHYAKAVHLQRQLPCGPCQQRVCPQGHHDCMRQLHPHEVIVAATRLLQQFAQSKEHRHAG